MIIILTPLHIFARGSLHNQVNYVVKGGSLMKPGEAVKGSHDVVTK